MEKSKDKIGNLKKKMNNLVHNLEELIMDIQEYNLENTQEALDFMDKINKLSVTF